MVLALVSQLVDIYQLILALLIVLLINTKIKPKESVNHVIYLAQHAKVQQVVDARHVQATYHYKQIIQVAIAYKIVIQLDIIQMRISVKNVT